MSERSINLPFMGDFDRLLANLDSDPQTRGRQFERICKWFLTNDPVYRHELRNVWLWDEWGGRWGADAGIDLVAEDRNGNLWAIQAKAYDPKYRITKKDVNKFLAESGREAFTYRMLVATTDLIDRIGERTIQDQEKRVTFFRLNDFRAADVEWPSSPSDLSPSRPRKPARPRPYQRDAIRDVVKEFESADRGQLIMACGTGKTLTALFIAERLESKRTLALLPSLSLLKQTLNVWRANSTIEFASLPVCSDDTVARTDDVAVAHASDLGVPVTTDADQIAAFLRQRSGPQVVFATYQSSPQIAKAFTLGLVPGFDLVIADEAHRCGGPVSSDFATVLDPAEINAKRRLFMTATPRYFTGRVVKAAQDADYEVASMDDETKFGTVFHSLTFGEAIKRNLLTDYQIAIIGVDDATYREWAEKGALVTRDGKEIVNAATLAGQIGLAKAMRKYDLHRVITFHSRVKSAKEFAASMPGVIDWMPARQRPKKGLWARHASGEMPAGDRYVLLQHLGRMNDSDYGLLANARCLAEGIDVPTLDGVAFIDPRRSEVDIVQAVGRAIRKSEDKTVGTIVIPVFIDTDADPEAVLDDSAFKPVWDVIKALRAHDDELGEQLDALRRAMGKTGHRPRLPEKISADIPATVAADFARAFDVRLVEQTTASWEERFGCLEAFVRENGHSQVPYDYISGGVSLGRWAEFQRHLAAKGTLSAERRQRLERLHGWSWNLRDSKWERAFDLLLQYVDHNGNARVPKKIVIDGYPLGAWVDDQRVRYAKGVLDNDRKERLGVLPGWSWEPTTDRWEEGFRHLQEFVKRYGHARVKGDEMIDEYPLGRWCSKQRTRNAKGLLEERRWSRLGALPGWSWDVHADRWEEGYSHLLLFVDQQGHSRVPQSEELDGYPVGIWVAKQRSEHTKGVLGSDRAERLKSLPKWSWNPSADKWDEAYQSLVEYVDRHGDALVPQSFVTDGIRLGSWVNTQRNNYTAGKLHPERRERLEALEAWTWNSRNVKRSSSRSNSPPRR
jgi:superfamily II DNA or RNA helicase